MTKCNRFVIRAFDIFFASIALLVFSPILVCCIVILSTTGEREIFFVQKRVGKAGKIFKLLKFATMLKNSPSIGSKSITLKDDPRILPFGKFLRKTKINEIPQLINVIKGDMSLIGPRPLTELVFNFYDKQEQDVVLFEKPGLSGVGSIYFRDEEKLLNAQHDVRTFYKEQITPKKAKLERWFVENYSIKNYFILIIYTILVIIFPGWNIKLISRLGFDIEQFDK